MPKLRKPPIAENTFPYKMTGNSGQPIATDFSGFLGAGRGGGVLGGGAIARHSDDSAKPFGAGLVGDMAKAADEYSMPFQVGMNAQRIWDILYNAPLPPGTIQMPLVVTGITVTSFTQGSVVFVGPSGALAQDNANFFWNDTTNALGLRTALPNSTLQVTGSMALSIVSTTITLTLDATHYAVLADATAGAITVNLPTAVGITGRVYVVKKIDASANTVTIDPAGAELIDGAATRVLSTRWESVAFQSNGTSWFIIADPLAGAAGGGITAIRLENVDVVNPATIIDFDNRDFNVTLEAAGEGLIQILDKLDIHSWSTPTILSANQNDYAFTGGDATKTGQRVSSDASSRLITGIAAKTAGFIYILRNIGVFNVLIGNQQAASAAANRIITGTAGTLTLAPDEILMLIYDDTTARWACWPKVYSATTIPTSSPYDPGDITIADLNYKVMAAHLVLSGTERATLSGNARLAIV